MNLWKVLIDKPEAEVYGKIKTITQGQRLKAYGIVYRLFTDGAGFGLAKEATRLMHPEPLWKEQ